MSFMDPEYLDDLASKNHESYITAEPFPHIIIDNFLPEFVLDAILEEFPEPGKIGWKTFDDPSQKKLASQHEQQMGEATRLLLYQLNSATFVEFLEKLTGIEGIISDPHFIGGGLHQIERGGFLKIHADFNRHRRLRLDRRLNLLIYLNKDWQEDYGGHFELWDREMKQCEKQVLPVFNRCVIFNTNDFSYHGHPNPLTCPEGRTRKSLALYYYSNGRPEEELSGSHSTLFKSRPGESLPQKQAAQSGWKSTLRKFVPPIIMDAFNGK
ncbi:MAG: 2OG-Fe(II) oxygenase [Oscillatoriales cyanobacterium RM2_1_1]|nr:2OG-Fe(II) oxygenase [Oscillatoriales cyanobacterium SM2_3_0]NJO46414.1 2OG-Fe(II) oxygenase [Oscillatoriales cyanobacterium RM2_1_1]